jgi:Flp pilus assembly protein CpaB
MNAPRIKLARLTHDQTEPAALNGGSAPKVRPRQQPRPSTPVAAPVSSRPRGGRLREPLPLAGIVLVLVALIGYWAIYSAGAKRTQVLLATRALPAGTVLTANDLRSGGLAGEASALATMLPASDASRLVGQRLAGAIAAGAPLSAAALAGRSASASAFTLSVPAGEVTGENLQPGDRVAVLATYTSGSAASTRPVARDLQVLSVGALTEDAQASTSTVPVAVALTQPSAASQLALADQAGKIDVLLEGSGASTAAIPQASEGGNP